MGEGQLPPSPPPLPRSALVVKKRKNELFFAFEDQVPEHWAPCLISAALLQKPLSKTAGCFASHLP